MSWRKASVSSSHAFTGGIPDDIIMSSRSCGVKVGSDSNYSHTSFAVSLSVQKISMLSTYIIGVLSSTTICGSSFLSIAGRT